MRILMLNYEFPPLGGGAGNATYYLLREFSILRDCGDPENSLRLYGAGSPHNRAISVTLVTSSASGFKKEKFSDDIEIYYLDVGKKGNIHYQSMRDLLVYSWKAFWFCRRLIKSRAKESIVNCQLSNVSLVHAFFGIPCGFVAMLLGIPYIVSLRGSDVPFYSKRFYWLDKLFFRKLSRKIWRKAKAVITNSEGLRELALKTAPGQEIDVIYNGVDTQKFNALVSPELTNKLFTVISTSRLIERKGISYLIEAFIDFNSKCSNSRLLLVGDGDLKEKLGEKVWRAGIEKSVEFLGAVPHGKMPEQYRRADVFVLPSHNEGMSNSLLEAMASGLAVIATDTGGTKELIDDNGLIIKKGSTQDIFESLEKLYVDKDLLHDMKKNSRKKAETMSWENMANNYIGVYKSLIK